MSSSTGKLYDHLVYSHLQIAGIAGVLLMVCLCMIFLFQKGAAVVAEVRLPSSLASTKVANGIDHSISVLRSNVLLGSASEDINTSWTQEIFPGIQELKQLSGNAEGIEILERDLVKLRESQWWVLDVANSVGNNPARQIYEQALLPIYDRIDRTLVGFQSDPISNNRASDIRLTAAITHQQLSEAVRQLSEIVRSGSIAELQTFREGSLEVQKMLLQLSEQVQLNAEERPLIDWILREYRVYEELANQTVRIRQSTDWNRALYLIQNETEPMAYDVKLKLEHIHASNNTRLLADVARNDEVTNIGMVINVMMIVGLMATALFLAKSRARSITDPISKLATASDRYAHQDDSFQLNLHAPDEITHLADRFASMGKELTRRNRDLENANEELQEYTHIITHDLKAPLINIKGHSDVVIDKLLQLIALSKNQEVSDADIRAAVENESSNGVSESANYISQSISKANHLIAGILGNSQLLFRQVYIEQVSVNNVIDRVFLLFSHRFDEITLTHDAFPDWSTDLFLLEHILTNLLDNAIKYLDPHRPGVINVAYEEKPDALNICIIDNGIGYNGRQQDDLFKLFQRGDHDREGTGIGLSLAQTMVKKLDGKIWYSNNNDHGMTFIFSLPRG